MRRTWQVYPMICRMKKTDRLPHIPQDFPFHQVGLYMCVSNFTSVVFLAPFGPTSVRQPRAGVIGAGARGRNGLGGVFRVACSVFHSKKANGTRTTLHIQCI
jgi:hypothetical protein